MTRDGNAFLSLHKIRKLAERARTFGPAYFMVISLATIAALALILPVIYVPFWQASDDPFIEM